MPKQFEVSGASFIGLFVRNAAAAAEFYEKKLGFRRDPNDFQSPGAAVAFLSYPIPFAVIEAPPGVDLDSIPRPIRMPSVWFKTANSQIVHDSLVEARITILRPPSHARFGRQFSFQDLDGYPITIYHRAAPPHGWEIPVYSSI